jgi:hypothetical protein
MRKKKEKKKRVATECMSIKLRLTLLILDHELARSIESVAKLYRIPSGTPRRLQKVVHAFSLVNVPGIEDRRQNSASKVNQSVIWKSIIVTVYRRLGSSMTCSS